MIRFPVHRHARPAQCVDGEIRGPVHERRHQDFAGRDGKQQEGQRKDQRPRDAGAEDRDDRGLNHEGERELLEAEHFGGGHDEPHGPGKKDQREAGPPRLRRKLRERVAALPRQPQADRHDDKAVGERFGTPPDRDDRGSRLPIREQDGKHAKTRRQHWRVPPGRPRLKPRDDGFGAALRQSIHRESPMLTPDSARSSGRQRSPPGAAFSATAR